jgi:endoribonuclease Dicer
MESIIAAIYLSDNFSSIGVESFFDNLLKPFYDKHITLKTLTHHPTKNLFEMLQAQGCRRFRIVKEITGTGLIFHQGELYSNPPTRHGAD